MDSRRLSGIVLLIALVAAFVAFLTYDNWRQPPVTAFAPAESADESVPPPDAATAAAPAAAAPMEAAGTAKETATASPPAETASADADAPAAGMGAASGVTGDAPSETANREAPLPDTAVATADPAAEAAAAIEELVEGAAPAPMPEIDAGVPSFDVVRVEPTGEAVIAGQAEPNATVEVLDGAESIATAQSSDRGEWVVTLDQPLAPGTHDLAVRTTSADKTVATLSDQRVTVSVPEQGDDVLVVLNDPDEASRVLQVPEGTPAGARETAAAAAPAATAGDDMARTTPAAEEQPQVAAAAPPSPPADRETLPPPAGTEVAAAPPPGSDKPGDTERALAAETAAADRPAETPMGTEVPTAESAAGVASAPPAEPAPPPPEPAVAVAAVEADAAGQLYIAGTAATGETVRIYLDGAVVGDAEPSPTGTWLLETTRDMPAGTYSVRADQVDNAGEVIARSEVPFEREVEVATLKPTVIASSSGGAAVVAAMPEMQTVIIKRGDNLWRIARSAWGKGVRWSTIYQANDDQIRDPDLIYPGQVFLMPAGDTSWQN